MGPRRTRSKPPVIRATKLPPDKDEELDVSGLSGENLNAAVSELRPESLIIRDGRPIQLELKNLDGIDRTKH